MVCNKNRYPTKKMADKYTYDFNKNPFLKEKDFLTSYICMACEGWHVGHAEDITKLTPSVRLNRLLDSLQEE